MVAMFEVAFLIVLTVLVVWWFRRTNTYRARRESGAGSPGQAAEESLQKHPPKGGHWA
jgi:hypothetical protein